jgi:hypothetical protein
MSTETLEFLIERFQELAKKIDLKAKEFDDVTVEAALLLRKLRAIVEADGAKWYGWAGEHLKMGRTKLRSLLRISEADDPRRMIEYLRRQNAKRQENFRARHKTPSRLDAERRDLVKWAQTADLNDVKAILAVVRRRTIWSASLSNIGPAIQPAVH